MPAISRLHRELTHTETTSRNPLPKLICQAAINSAAGYYAGHFFHIVKPAAGGVFGATIGIATLVSAIAIRSILDCLNIQNRTIRLACDHASLFMGGACALTVTTSAGFALTPVNAVLLGIVIVANKFFVEDLLELTDSALRDLRNCLA